MIYPSLEYIALYYIDKLPRSIILFVYGTKLDHKAIFDPLDREYKEFVKVAFKYIALKKLLLEPIFSV